MVTVHSPSPRRWTPRLCERNLEELPNGRNRGGETRAMMPPSKEIEILALLPVADAVRGTLAIGQAFAVARELRLLDANEIVFDEHRAEAGAIARVGAKRRERLPEP